MCPKLLAWLASLSSCGIRASLPARRLPTTARRHIHHPSIGLNLRQSAGNQLRPKIDRCWVLICNLRESIMKQLTFALAILAMLAGLAALQAPAAPPADQSSASV